MTDVSDCDENTVESVDMWDSPLSRLALNRPDNLPPVTDLPPVRSSGRKTTLSSKLRDCGNTLERTFNANRSARIKCGQKGREYTASLKDLTNEDGTLAEEDLVEGKELMWKVKGKSYPVTFLHIYVKGGTKRSRAEPDKIPSKNDEVNASKRAKLTGKKNSDGASAQSNPLQHHDKSIDPPPSSSGATKTFLDQKDKDLLVDLATRIEKLEKKLDRVLEALKTTEKSTTSKIKPESEDTSGSSKDYTVNGINLLRLQARDVYGYGLQLLDALFTKEELSGSLLFKSKKSSKPPLEHDRVEKLLDILEKKFPGGWDLKTLTQKINQKCRDTKVIVLED